MGLPIHELDGIRLGMGGKSVGKEPMLTRSHCCSYAHGVTWGCWLDGTYHAITCRQVDANNMGDCWILSWQGADKNRKQSATQPRAPICLVYDEHKLYP